MSTMPLEGGVVFDVSTTYSVFFSFMTRRVCSMVVMLRG